MSERLNSLSADRPIATRRRKKILAVANGVVSQSAAGHVLAINEMDYTKFGFERN